MQIFVFPSVEPKLDIVQLMQHIPVKSYGIIICYLATLVQLFIFI